MFIYNINQFKLSCNSRVLDVFHLLGAERHWDVFPLLLPQLHSNDVSETLNRVQLPEAIINATKHSDAQEDDRQNGTKESPLVIVVLVVQCTHVVAD